ncbi:hypothetical protein LCGC14_2940890, partial [marine sediment metagenome]
IFMLKKPATLALKYVLFNLLAVLKETPGKTNEDSYDFLRICLKGLLHDLESTKREKNTWKRC